MPSRHQVASENAVGLVLLGNLGPDQVSERLLWPPYRKVLRAYKKGTTITKLQSRFGYALISAALVAGEAIKEDTKIDWIADLEEASVKTESGELLEKLGRELIEGNDVDISKLALIADKLRLNRTEWTTLDQVEPDRNPFVKSYFPPVDKHGGGLIKAGMTIIGGDPGTGKSSLAGNMICEMVRAKKKVGIVSLEMTLGQIVTRLMDESPKITKAQRRLVYGSDVIAGVEDIGARIARLKSAEPDLHAVFVDFADYMVEGEQSEATMGIIYRTLAILGKTLTLPIVLICQLSRHPNSILPNIHNLRYSRMAEATARLIYLCFNYDALWDAGVSGGDNDILPYVPGTAYIIVGKSNFGFVHGTAGAIRMKWGRELGWIDKNVGWVRTGGTLS